MCRIYGYLGEREISPAVVEAVWWSQIAGGPDEQSFLRGDHWGIGNNRLAIVDLTGGKQPFSLGEKIQVVFNGEIYNHRALRRELVERGYVFHDQCDGSIIPALYAEFGLDFVKRLDGMFAIAIVDLRETTKLILVNDAQGIKSVYYHFDSRDGQFYFSSEIPSLLEFGISRDIWIPGIDAYFSTKAIFGSRTMFDAVHTLPPGSCLITELGQTPTISTWNSQFECDEGPGDIDTDGTQLANLLQDEVTNMLIADVPIATINSGGLDSSFVTALASRRVEGIHSFHISYVGDWPFDEKQYARDLAEKYGTHHHEIEIDPKDFRDLLPNVIRHLGQPNADPITLSSYALFQAVHDAGFKVALSGDGADEMFGGYARLARAVAGSANWISEYVDQLAAIDRKTRWELYSDDYREFLMTNGLALQTIEDQLQNASSSRLRSLLQFEQAYRLPAYHLRRVDHLSMAHSVEIRVPFCQNAVVQFSRQLPEDMLISNGRVKYALYKAASSYLPQSILTRPKQPFTLPITAMMTPGQSLYSDVTDILLDGNLQREGFFNTKTIESLLHKQALDPNDSTALALWTLMTFELWNDQFRRGATNRQLSFLGVL